MICRYQGDELAAGHIEHAHAVALVHARAFVEQQERHKRACHCVWRALKAKGISPRDAAAVQAAIGAKEEAVREVANA